MRYRILGRTGLKVSELGFGGHEYRRMLNPYDFPAEGDMEEFLKTQPQRDRLIKNAIDDGVNYFDTTFAREAKSLGLALRTVGRRRGIHVAAMIIFPFKKMKESPRSRWREIIFEGVEERLRLLQIDRIDVFNIHRPESDYLRGRLETALKALEEMKHRGRIRSIGASSHEPSFLAELIRKHDCFDSVMVRYNYHLQMAREAIFPLCKALDVGVVVMKPFAWPHYGIPFMSFAHTERKQGYCKAAQASLRWILSCPEVSTVVPSMNSLDELTENLAAVTEECKVDEEMLKRCLRAAQSPQAERKLRRMLKAPETDIRRYAKRALNDLRTT